MTTPPALRFGIITPVVTLAARTHAAWERDAGPAEIRDIAIAADRLGYSHLTCSEHVAIPSSAEAVRGGRYYDPAATLGYVAALTERIRLLTHVVVVPYHHPLAIVKRYGTLDRLAGGRLILGVGVGSLEEEFALLGVAFADRGARYEDALRALRAAFGQRSPCYDGTFYSFAKFVVDPCSVQARPPLWLGGRSQRSLRRALELGDGWDPFGLDRAALGTFLDRRSVVAALEGRRAAGQPFDVVLTPEPPLRLESRTDCEAATDILREYQGLGATAVNVRFEHQSAAHYLELLCRFAEEVMPSI